MQNNGEVVYTCMTSDFFLEEADDWRAEAWEMIRKRPDLHFAIITKRIARFPVSLPDDWEMDMTMSQSSVPVKIRNRQISGFRCF